MLAALLTSLAIAKRAPAWRGLQAVSPELQAEKEHGRLRGAPPCVRTLYKEGQGNEATWRLGSLRYLGPTVPDGTPHHPDLQVSLGFDKNPAEPCCKLLFRADGLKLGHMLLASGDSCSALRGMRIREDWRGLGLSKLLLATWLHMCSAADLAPRTRTINKPLLSLSLARFGFTPTNQRGELVHVSNAVRLRDCDGLKGSARTSRKHRSHRRAASTPAAARGATLKKKAWVRTELEPPAKEPLAKAVATALHDSKYHLLLEATPSELHRALTLRGGAMGGAAPLTGRAPPASPLAKVTLAALVCTAAWADTDLAREVRTAAATGEEELEAGWLQRMVRALDRCRLGKGGSIPTDRFLDVMETIPPVYEALFKRRFIISALQKDVTNAAQTVRERAAEVPEERGTTLQGMVAHELRELGGAGIRKDKVCGSHSLVWLNRASTFITKLMRGIADGAEPSAAASAAYDSVLRPYHGFVAQKVAGAAMSLCPAKPLILAGLRLPSEEVATRQMDAFLRRMEPLSAAVLEMLNAADGISDIHA